MKSRNQSDVAALVFRNTLWNLAGSFLPLIAAVVALPMILRALGDARFGLLSIAWTLLAYFGIFDLGLGRATTQQLASLGTDGEVANRAALIWSSVAAHAALGIVGAAALALLTPTIVSALNLEQSLVPEARVIFSLIAVSIPVVVLSSCARGVLEAYHRFDIVNGIRIPAAVANYLVPVAVPLAGGSLIHVVIVLAAVRVVVLFVHAVACAPYVPRGGPIRMDTKRLANLARAGAWIGFSALFLPTIAAADRFIIGSRASVADLAYYATPYEVIARLWILSGGLLAALFPVLSSLATRELQTLRRVSYSAAVVLTMAAAIPVGLLIAFADVGLHIWLGPEFALRGTLPSRFLAAGMLASIVAQVPFTVLQSIGRPAVVGIVQLIQVPVYIAASLAATTRWGIAGAAAVWAARAALELPIFSVTARRALHTGDPAESQSNWIRPAGAALLVVLGCWCAAVVIDNLMWRTAGVLLVLLIALTIMVKSLDPEVRRKLIRSTRRRLSQHQAES